MNKTKSKINCPICKKGILKDAGFHTNIGTAKQLSCSYCNRKFEDIVIFELESLRSDLETVTNDVAKLTAYIHKN